MIRALRNLARLLSIARTLARHDALFPLEALGLGPLVPEQRVAALHSAWRI